MVKGRDNASYQVIVIGGGPAGVIAALRASELGAKVALVERGRMGGTCTNDGCVPTRVFAKAARLARDARHFEDYGLISQPPELDFSRLLQRAQQVVYQIHEKKQLLAHLDEAGVDVYHETGEAQFLDPYTIQMANRQVLHGEKFILCTGGHARRLLFPGSDYAITHHEVWSLKKLPASVAIIGAGATGCQIASIMAAFGTHVHLIQKDKTILSGEDLLVCRVMAEALQQRGIQIVLKFDSIESLEPQGNQFRLSYSKEDWVEQIECEAVILATGWPGNADELNLGAAGVITERGYIVVDEMLRTSAAHIFAAGDITGRMMLVQSANNEARIAAENAVLNGEQPFGHHIVPHGGFTDPEYASVGISEERARAAGLDIAVAVVSYADLDRAVIDGHTEGFCKLIVSQENHRLVGAHVVGEDAVEAIQVVAAAMAADMWVEQLAELEMAYPTYTAILGMAARRLVYEMGVMPLSQQWLALGRRVSAEWERSDSP